MVTLTFDVITILVQMSSRRKRNESPEYGGLGYPTRRRIIKETKDELSLVKIIDPESGDSKIVDSEQSEKSCTHSKIESKSSHPLLTLMDP